MIKILAIGWLTNNISIENLEKKYGFYYYYVLLNNDRHFNSSFMKKSNRSLFNPLDNRVVNILSYFSFIIRKNY